MNKAELKRALTKAGVKPQFYSLEGRLREDAFILQETGERWCVFYHERGERSMERIFDSEEKACLYLYGMLRDAPSVK